MNEPNGTPMNKLIDPFRYLAGFRALGWGATVLIFSSVAAWQTDVVPGGALSFGYGDRLLWASVVAHLLVWLVPATVFYLTARYCSPSKVRAVDIYGTNLFARIPAFGIVLLSGIPAVRDRLGEALADPQQLAELVMQPWFMVWTLAVLLLSVWYFAWTWSAFSVSANLRGGKGVALFILGFIVGDCLTRYVLAGIF